MSRAEMIDSYFPDLGDEIYASADEQLTSWATFLDMLCDTSFDDDEDASSDEFFDVFYRLYQKGYSAEAKPLYPLSAVVAYGLKPVEIFTVILASVYTCGLDRTSLFRDRLEDVTDGKILTVEICLDLAGMVFSNTKDETGLLFDRDSFLNRCILKGQDADLIKRDGVNARVVLRDSVAGFIASGKMPNEAALLELNEESSVRYIAAPAHPCIRVLGEPDGQKICLKDTYDEISKAFSYGGVIELDGAEGSGRRFLLTHVASDAGKKIVQIDMKLYADMADDNKIEECIHDIVFMCRVQDYVPYLWCTDDPDGYADRLRDIFVRLSVALPTVCIGANKPVADAILGGLSESIYRIDIPETTAKHQVSLWQEAAKKYALSFPKKYDFDVLVSKYIMSPGRIYETMRNVAAAMTDAAKKTIPEDVLEEQIRRSCSVQFGENATRLSSPFTWDDLMISAESEKLLRMAADRVRYRTTVNEDFGFAKKLPYGRGVAIVFYGPPGTGKTMAAQVLANDLGLDIYRIDLSQVSSKYIGETEKNLGAVFDAAKNSNAILFFDEADSLFSKRTEVSSSNDKYANAETSYLLQKIEEYSGVSVLATNNMQSFDAAFKRRMTFVIPVETPDEDTRKRLWEAVFPEGAPLDESVDIRILAHSAELTGSSIKSAAVSAAYLAAAEGRSIGWEDIITAIDMEGVKTGTLGLGNRLREAMLSGID